MYRRDFLVRTGQVIGAVALTSALRTAEAVAGKQSYGGRVIRRHRLL